MTKNLSNLPHEVEVESISPKKAAEYLDGTFERNRPIVADAVQMYANRIVSGDFLTATPIVFAHVAETDRFVLVDGQHRLSAVISSKKSMKFTVQTYYLQKEEQLAELYGTLDTGRARNLADNVRAHGLPDFIGLNQVDSTMIVSALNFVVFKKPAFNIAPRHSGTFQEQIERSKEWIKEATWYLDLLKKAPHPMKLIARRKAIVAAAMITLRGYPAKAKPFWEGVLTLDGTSSVDTRFKLHMKLIEIDSRSNKNNGPRKSYVSSWHVASLIAACWNAYISNRQLQVIKGLANIVFKRCRWREEK